MSVKQTYTVVVETTHKLPVYTIPDRIKYAMSWMDGLKGVTVSKKEDSGDD